MTRIQDNNTKYLLTKEMTRKDVQSNIVLNTIFDEYDVNKNGKLDDSEWDKYQNDQNLIAKRREEDRKRFQSLKGKNFRVQRGRKVLRTYKIINIYGQTRWDGVILFRERIFTRNGIKEHIRIKYQPLYVLEKKLGRKVK